MIGRNVSHYEIIGELGEGGMGKVYRATDSKLGRQVALKILPPVFAQDDERVARFQREAELLASLNHPNIGAIYGFEHAEDTRALVLELIEGPTLDDRVRLGAMPLDEAIPVALQIAEAVEAAHERGIVHRDLKPQNIKLTEDGRVKVLDFGLAKALETEQDNHQSSVLLTQSPTITGAMTGDNVILGTAAYMSPEQARGQAVDKRADIWSFGVILYEMLTGRMLFREETVSDSLAAVLRADLNLDALPAETPRSVRRLIGRCLERDPKLRLRDMGEARIALQRAQSGEEEEPAAEGPAVVEKKSGPGLALLLPAALLAAVIGATVMWFLNRPADTGLPLRKSAIVFERTDPGAGIAFDARMSPDGERVAYVSKNQLWVRELANLKPRAFPGTEGAVQPFWSPEGDWLGYFTDESIWKVPAAGGEPIQIGVLPSTESFAAGSAGAAWGPDGKIAFCTGNGGIFLVSAQGGDATLFVEANAPHLDFHDLRGLPDGRGWIFVIHLQEGGAFNKLGVATRDGSVREILDQGEHSLYDPFYSSTGHVLFYRSRGASGIFALPFSLDALETTGEPFLVAANGRKPSAGANGSLCYASGTTVQRAQLTASDREGRTIGTYGEPGTYYPFPAVSADETRCVIRMTDGDTRELWSIDLVRGTSSRLTFSGNRKDMATWGPDGQTLYSYEGEVGAFNLLSMPADGTQEPTVLRPGALPHITLDGQTMLFAMWKDDDTFDFDIYSVPADDPQAEPTVLFNSKALEWAAVASPNGRYLAYVSDEGGEEQVYVTAYPSLRGKWQISLDGGDWPRWRPDGNELYYASDEGIWAVEVSTEGGFRAGKPDLVVSRVETSAIPWADGFDVSADGQRFYYLAPVAQQGETEPPSIVVVQNWLEEFEDAP